MSQVMSRNHPLWTEFYDKLVEKLEFREDPEKGYKWLCSGKSKKLTRDVLISMGLEVDSSIEALGWGCDCEIVFNSSRE